jgi:hypothetical protein
MAYGKRMISLLFTIDILMSCRSVAGRICLEQAGAEGFAQSNYGNLGNVILRHHVLKHTFKPRPRSVPGAAADEESTMKSCRNLN